MSAIAGIYHPDGRPVEHDKVDRMLETLVHRGPDREGVWTEGPVGLGHRMLWTTPESLEEKLPMEARRGGPVITADARIDNRVELISSLGIDGPHAEVSDSELILRAYDRWGEGCVERLLGDFSFTIWDPKRHILFSARDPFGIKPFYYYHNSGKAFVFASEIKALLSLKDVPRRVNDRAVAEYLEPFIDVQSFASTMYEGILRLPPAHTMTVTRHGLRLNRYWALDPAREIRLSSDEEYAEAFREIFTEAVGCRLRSAYPVGTELSGGLDSSSITCTASGLLSGDPGRRLHTFTAAFDDSPGADESLYVRAVLAKCDVEPHIIPHIIRGTGHINAADIEQNILHQDEPHYPPTLLTQWPLYRAARSEGVRVLLDGFDGDSTVLHGVTYLPELFCAGRLRTLANEIRRFAANERLTPWRTFRSYVLNPLAPEYVLNAWNRFKGRPSPQSYYVINPDLDARFEITGHRRAWMKKEYRRLRNTKAAHMFHLDPDINSILIEIREKAATAFSLELRHPFFDRRLAEFCLALPAGQKLARGWTRVVLRRAMEGVLPELVQWRTDKGRLSEELLTNAIALKKTLLDELVDDEYLGEYVDKGALERLYERYYSNGDISAGMVLWFVMMLGVWFRQFDMQSCGADGAPASEDITGDGQLESFA